MTDSEVFTVAVYTKGLERVGWVGDPEVLTVTPRHNQQGSASLSVRDDHPMRRALATPGARVVIHYRDEYLMGGLVRPVQSEGAGFERRYTFGVIDDWRIFTRLLGWPNPSGSISQQGDEGAYDVRSGPAETVAKSFLSANLARVGSGSHNLPTTVAPSQGRGSSITVQMRMHPLADRLFPLVDQAGIGLQVRQTLTGLRVDAYEPQTWPLTLSEDGGTLIANDWTLQPPEVTRVVVMASGVGDARVMRGPFINAAAEATYRDVIEEAVDARDLDATAAGFTAAVTERANARLAEGAAKAGLSIKLAETEVFQYGGSGVHVGDRVNVELEPATDEEPAITVTDVLRAATLTWAPDRGPEVTPMVGDRSDDPDSIIHETLAALARRQRDQAGG